MIVLLGIGGPMIYNMGNLYACCPTDSTRNTSQLFITTTRSLNEQLEIYYGHWDINILPSLHNTLNSIKEQNGTWEVEKGQDCNESLLAHSTSGSWGHRR